MKNEFQKHKKSDSIKWIITFICIAILIFTTVGLVVRFSNELFPEDFLSGIRGETKLQFATKIASAEDDVVVNYYDIDMNLIESKSMKAGEGFEVIEGAEKYYFVMPSKIEVPSQGNFETSVIIDGKFCKILDFENPGFSSFYPSFAKVDDTSFAINLPLNFMGQINDKTVIVDSTSDLIIPSSVTQTGVDGLSLCEGDSLEIESSFQDGIISCNGYIYWDISDYAGELYLDLDYVNVMVADYTVA